MAVGLGENAGAGLSSLQQKRRSQGGAEADGEGDSGGHGGHWQGEKNEGRQSLDAGWSVDAVWRSPTSAQDEVRVAEITDPKHLHLEINPAIAINVSLKECTSWPTELNP